MIDVSRQRRSLLSDATALHHLPSEILATIQDPSSTKLLDAIAEAALHPLLTERIFVHFEDVFADICARWTLDAGNGPRALRVASAMARVLPFVPNLSVFLRCPEPRSVGLLLPKLDTTSNTDGDLLQILLMYWRLLSFDLRTFGPLVSPALAQSLFSHPDRAVRYLAIRVFCQLLQASDHKLETLIEAHVGTTDAIIADFDGVPADYGFLSLHERARAKKVLALRQEVARWQGEPESGPEPDAQPCLQSPTPYVVSYGKTILPRPSVPTSDPSTLVMTTTTTKNLERLAAMLRNPEPILLHGLPGVGKTALVHEMAKQLGTHANMVTLHLNEQTDAKMLIGLYSTDSTPGSFSWRPGVLTTAVKEGRWVLVEDLDRAPTEVLSTFLPLIERNELLIPSRGERIRAANSFRLFATVRTSRGMNGRENLPSIVGMRFWQSLYTEPAAQSELEEIVLQSYPILRKFLPGILAVYGRLSRHSVAHPGRGRGRGQGLTDRPMSLRDLLKWCRRLKECLLAGGSVSGEEPISESTRDFMFMEAVDCFVGGCPDEDLSRQLVYAIAEEMHLSRERADHYLTANIPPLEENDVQFRIGRVQLQKKKKKLSSRMIRKSQRPFASTLHAKKLLEQIAVAVKLNEPVLLVGETGIGKTTVVQQLAESLGHKLIAVNLSQQSEVGDLLGGFKPVNVRSLAVPLKEEFEDLFSATGISASKNQKYLEQVGKTLAKGQWSKLAKLWREAPKMFLKILSELERAQSEQAEARETSEARETRDGDAQQPMKRRKTQSRYQTLLELKSRWGSFSRNLEQFEIQISGSGSGSGSGGFAFSFVEGNLVKAVRNGDWVLLDEINLASPDTLEGIVDLLTGPSEEPSLLLSETGEIEKIVAHPNFRIFGAMNPATDIGKRDLPIGIRSRFTELYVKSPDKDLKDLLTIIKAYLGNNSNNNSSSRQHDQAADDIARLYLNTKRMAEEKRLVDGANEVPHFSLRTLTRVLSYVNTISPLYGVRRALYEGFSMGFLTLLDRDSEKMLLPLIYHHLLDRHGNGNGNSNGNPQQLLSQPPKRPTDGKQYVRFQNQSRDRQYWLFQGNETPIERDDYIITPYVERNLLNLVRATSTRRFPILIQGPTSAGKTSMIEYLANFTGNKFVRINNHEHTDLQEYLGTYVSGADGKLRFQEGLLVQAMRQGHWIVLDELNLAPTDVLEALNRLLDDNRELLIPETQEIVRPHENFILFATQNPPGLYGGRKVLSRAFRNRFLELHFDDIPEDELEYILQQRSRNTSPPDCRRIVTVYKELSRLRQTSRVFEKKDSFATLRDLFRWALRDAETREEIAAHGFMLLAERVRNEEERVAVKEVIEKVFKVTLDPRELYSASVAPELKQFTGETKTNSTNSTNSQGVVWTHAIRRLYVLVSRALRNNEPVLLVGETGCGKTTVVQLLAEAVKQELSIVNAHQNTETGDLIGSQRPIRNRGGIVEALDTDLAEALERCQLDPCTSGPMTTTEMLARYKTIEASLLESHLPLELRERILLNETRSKALFEWSDGALVQAMRSGHFFLLDEISLADDSVLERLNSVLEPQRTLLLAEKGIDNSFVQAAQGFQFFATMNPGGDFGKKELSPALRNRFTEIWVPPLSESDDIFEIVRHKLNESAGRHVEAVVQFAAWFGKTFRPMATAPFSVREVLAWVQFINTFPDNDPVVTIVHGAAAIFIDSLGANPSAMLAIDIDAIQNQRRACLEKLGDLLGRDVSTIYETQPELAISDSALGIGAFSTPRTASASSAPGFAFHAPTTRLNAMRVVRAMQTNKPILLEGSPGVGKTSLVVALSQACGRPLTRINLSDQTDLIDLFGTDVPVEGEEAGNFAWRDAPFLQAMQKGEWVLLDEMNLASQSVLEGLNACLDHRGEVYVSELDQVFKRHPDFRLFAAQNPHHQGGGRKGLPASFVNRFIVVYADVFKAEDLSLIASHSFPGLDGGVIDSLIRFVSQMEHQLVVERSFGAQGGPWEFNLRDVLRWLSMLSSADSVLKTRTIDDFLDIVVKQRFRTQRDRDEVDKLYSQILGSQPRGRHFYHDISSRFGQVGLALLARDPDSQPERLPNMDIVSRFPELESTMLCVKLNIPCILSSPSGYGKSMLLEYVAALAGRRLVVFPMNADIDTMDLVGGFEQADPLREINSTIRSLRDFLQVCVMALVPGQAPDQVLRLLHQLDAYNGNSEAIPSICASISALIPQVAEGSEVAAKLSAAVTTLQGPLVLKNPRFEWLDGVIVKALESGQWLVLDNANMCNASVLDRLNSLLEPNGFLSINEHCGPGGEPRIVRPHPDFRIFLTMDPRYGELSRAMRNRAVEIHMHTAPPRAERCFARMADVESSLQRYCRSVEASQSLLSRRVASEACEVSLENLSIRDVEILPRFANTLSEEAVEYRELVQGFVRFFSSPVGSKTLQAVSQTYSKLSGGSKLSHAQPLHTLNNFTVSKLLPQVDEARWVAVCYETYRQLFAIQALLDRQESHARAAKLASLNRLQRSLISDRVAAVAKDTTVKLASFVSATLNAMAEFLGADFSSSALDSWRERAHLVGMVICYLDRTIALSTGQEFDEAVFQAHLAQGTSVLEKKISGAENFIHLDETSRQFTALVLQRLQDDFTSGFQLQTGLSMEPLWNLFRPIPLSDQSVLDRTLDLNRLAARFDHLRWKVGASIADLAKAQRTLEQAYRIVRDGLTSAGTEGLVQDLTSVIESLETRIGGDESDRLPWLADEFEALRQLDMLCSISMTGTSRVSISSKGTQEVELSIMSNIPTQARLMLASCGKQSTSKTLQSVDCLVHQGRYAWDGRLTASLWLKLQTMGSVSLGSLALLDMELPSLGQYLVSLSGEVTADPVLKLNDLLWQLLLDVFGAHGHRIKQAAAATFSKASQQLELTGRPLDSSLFDDFVQTLDPPHLQQIAVDHLIPCVVSLLAARSNSTKTQRTATTSTTPFFSLAWIHFAIGVLKLYVPDRVFDPYLRPKIEREYHLDLQTRLTDRISALIAFENSFTGQSTNERIDLLNRELSEMGPLPEEVQPVFRPKQSELSRLQAEFSNILKAITSPGLESSFNAHHQVQGDEGDDRHEGLALVRENVRRLLDRLSSRFEAYQDMTGPAVNLLRCLLVGLSLHDAANAKGLSPATDRVLKMSPFLGGSSWDLSTSSFSSGPDNSFEFLKLIHAAVAVEGNHLPSRTWEPVFRCFHAFYDDWKRKLEEDRKAEEAKASLYHFRGSLEDEEEVDEQQFNELFPTYDADADADADAAGEASKPSSSSSSSSRHLVRDTSLQVAAVHRKLFLDRGDPADAIRELCKAMGSRVAGETKDDANMDRELNGKLLNSALLLLDDKISRLRPVSTDKDKDKSYNFYADANLPEARQLVGVIQQIKSRFRELQQVDEIGHMQPLEDVVQSCNRVLELVNDDPLAKMLPKVETLHGFVYEWQFGGWASKTYAVLSLHNLLTDTIIRWRRLELSTWANLFDTEQRKCSQDADSWWFIAYQVVVAAPLSMVESPLELRGYAVSLTKTLEQYFSGSIVGQFRARVALLRQFQGHLKFLVREYPALSVIHDALANFVGYFSRYEKEADAAIQRGRASLEKKMKDVLLMASWKDTNINALRESAKKSHLKLFRIVRKFRAILGQEMKPIIDRGLPEENLPLLTLPQNALSRTVAIASQVSVPKEAVAALNETLPGWLETHKRLANAPKTVSIMAKVFSDESLEVTSSAAQTLDSYLASLDASMAELRRETPSTLTDENKEQVKHLKTRKRKLFADTLRELRNMGVRYNLGQDTLAEQDSLATVLASIALLDLKNANNTNGSETLMRRSEYYLHKVLCLVPKARAAAREHSEDLTGAEVARSIGFVEGLLHLFLSQRRSISAVSGSLLLLQESISQFRGLGDLQTLGNLARRGVEHDLPRLLPWALQGLKFAIHSLQVHGKLGNINHDAMISQLQSWSDKFASCLKQLGQFESTPRPFTSSSQAQVEEHISKDLQAFDRWVEEAIEGRGDLAFILRQLRVWTRVSLEHMEDMEASTPSTTRPLLEFADRVSTLCDTILVAVESARKAGAAGMPIKEDEAGWLTRHSDAHFSMLHQLHMKNVCKAVGRCMIVLQDVDLASLPTSTAAMSAIAIAAPILDQFSALCEKSLASSLDMYRATVQMGYSLTQSFITIASQGFCTPQEKSDETAGDSGKVETGTGLGDGEGAEDISKDIQPDEDLSELAQEANQEKNENMEDEKDAVDMADEDMEGDMGSVVGDDEDEKKGDEKEDEDEDEEDKEMDEEAGEVDDLDPTAVDEKMWDGGDDDDKAEKDQQGNKAKGQKQDDEQMATEGEAKGEEQEGEQEQEPEVNDNDNDNEPEAEDAGAEEEDVQAQEELNRQDQNVQDHDALELPEDLDMNIDEPETADGDDDDLDLMSDIEEKEDEAEGGQADAAEAKDKDEEDAENADGPLEEAADEDVIESEGEPEEVDEKMGGDEVQENPEENLAEEEEEQGEGDAEKEEEEEQAQRPRQDEKADGQDAAPSDVKGSGQDQNADAAETDDQFQARAAQQEDGEMGEGAADEDTSRGNQGASSRDKPVGQQENGDAEEAEEARKNPFKKLGDALEKWHRQRQDIKDAGTDEANEKQQEKEQKSEAEAEAEGEMGRKEFQHLKDDEDAEDAQAMGKADREEAQPLDESMAVDDDDDDDDDGDTKEDPASRVMDVDGDDDEGEEVDKMDVEPREEDTGMDGDESRTGVQTRQGNYNEQETPEVEEDKVEEEEEEEEEEDDGDEDEEVEDTSAQLSTTHLDDDRRRRPLRDLSSCLEEWSTLQAKSHSLSLSLTSQLRLILTPSQSTKLSGSFRTGKRLNIKRIIPYIASSYKRDKIWMRRAIPTKRTYQILLCVDDSKSMGESRSGPLAMESLVMVSRSLTMLEAGQVGVLGFGADVFTAHPLAEPFGGDAGAKVLQRFTFAQDRTDVERLIRTTVETFRAARQHSGGSGSGSGSGGADLWQLALILSDGLTPSSAHEGIRRLLREAAEERIMVVFIIMDDRGKKKGDSVLELKEARFVREEGGGGGSRVVIERYLDGFPFQYYLIVHEMEELPSALAGLLRTWFAEVSA